MKVKTQKRGGQRNLNLTDDEENLEFRVCLVCGEVTVHVQ